MDYDDPVKFVQDIHQHVLDTGHQVVPGDHPLRNLMGYACVECEGVYWYCSARSLKDLEGQSMEGALIRVAILSHENRTQLTQYLNSRTLLRPQVILSRYERPWVI
jgi:hypothetical protein